MFRTTNPSGRLPRESLWLGLSECAISLDDPVQARQSLEFVLGQDPKSLPPAEAENIFYQNKARKLIKTMKLD